MKTHTLKILPKYFKDVAFGVKTFELRENDRDFQQGDILILREYDPSEQNQDTRYIENGNYTGRKLIADINYVLKDCHGYGLDYGWCILGIKVKSVWDVDNNGGIL